MPQVIELLATISGRDTKGRNFAAGIVLWDGVVTEVSPKLHFMKKGKWTRDKVRAYCEQKQWRVEIIYEANRTRP